MKHNVLPAIEVVVATAGLLLAGCSRSDSPPLPKQAVAKAPVQAEPKEEAKAAAKDQKEPEDQAKPSNKTPRKEEFKRAKIKKVDLDRMIVTLTVGEKDEEFRVTDLTLIRGAKGSNLKERVAAFKEGADVSFSSVRAEGEAVLLSLSLRSRLPDP